MIDHFLRFADEVSAAAALPSLCSVDAKTGNITWAPHVLIQTVVMTDAVWSAPDKNGKRTLVTPQQNAAGFFLTVSTINEQAALKQIAAAKPIVLKRDAAISKAEPFILSQASDFASEDFAKAIRIEPVWFGTQYKVPIDLQASDFVTVPVGFSAKTDTITKS